MRNIKNTLPKNAKIEKTYKDYVPSSIKNLPREVFPLKNPEEFSNDFKPLVEPNVLFDEWPGDEEAKVTFVLY
jgi:hypothetical protein